MNNRTHYRHPPGGLSRRSLLAGAGALGGAALLGACSGNGSGSDQRLRFQTYFGEDQVKVWEQQFADFQERSGIEVTHEFVEQAAQAERLLTMAATNQLPDVTLISGFSFSALAERGYFAEITPATAEAQGIDIDDFFPGLVDYYRVDGAIHALPTDTDVGILFYNQDLFEQEGVDPPSPDWTWEDFRLAAAQLTKGSGAGKQFGVGAAFGLPHDLTMVARSYGGDLIDPESLSPVIADGGGRRALELYRQMAYEDGSVAPPGSAVDMSSGKIAMDIMGPWAKRFVLDAAPFEWGMALVPQGTQRSTYSFGSSIGVMASASNKEAAFSWVGEFLSVPLEVQRARDWSLYPPRRAAVEDPEFDMGFTPEQNQVIADSLAVGSAPTTVRELQRVQQAMTDVAASIANDGMSVDEAIAKLTEIWTPLLAEE